MRSAGSRRRSGEEQAPNSLGETKADSSTAGVWIWAAFPASLRSRRLRTDRADLMRRPCLEAGDVLVVWKLDRLGRSLPHLLAIVADLKARGVAFRSLTERMDTTTPQGELLFSIFGALAQYERALPRERVLAGLAAAKRRGRRGGRPPALDAERIEQITAALEAGASKASVCRGFKVPRSTLLDTLARVGWTGPMP